MVPSCNHIYIVTFIYLPFFEKKNFENFSDHSETFLYLSIHKKLNAQKKIQIPFVSEKKIGSLKETSFENCITVVRKGGFRFLWIMVL